MKKLTALVATLLSLIVVFPIFYSISSFFTYAILPAFLQGSYHSTEPGELSAGLQNPIWHKFFKPYS
jgi:hypothetical protein